MKSHAQLGTGTHDALRPACPISSDQDQERVHKAEFKAQEENKKKRKIRRARKKKNADKFSQNEGVTYAAG